jgi:predicted ester cyclase
MHSAFGEMRGLKNGEQLFSEFYDAFPDVHFILDDVIVEGDKAAIRYTVTCTQKGTFMGIPPTNKKISAFALEIDHFVNGKLVEYWTRFDTLGFMQQLGVVPPPGKQK